MLNEDGLLLLLVFGACVLVVLGTLELLWPTRPRHPRRRSAVARDLSRRPPAPFAPPPRAPRPARMAPPIARPPVARATQAPSPPPEPRAPAELLDAVQRRLAPLGTPPEPIAVVSPPAPVETVASTGSAITEPILVPEPGASVVDRGFALLKEQRHGEVVTLAEKALRATKAARGSAPTAGDAQDKARLWGLVGLAKHGLGDYEGARFALEEAVALASGSERPTWEGHLVALTMAFGRRSIAGAGTASPADRIASLGQAIEWLERGLAISPNDPEPRDVVTAARDALWGAHEAVVNDLLQRRALTEARRMLEDVIADPECPPERRLAFCRLLDGVNADAPRPEPR